ncbi:MAG: pyridoxal-phosphate dependent enzyme [Myxococcota bacterium]|jgi:1-aminocyclopropane-1-carboxylate deaminase/D-cysteine desulfhydrase-like pyridoxal-dependent ACC family enzyme|nr:pyridoxal-phosphate dependent enzyme [Myxococcota bacterium]
MEKTSGEEPSAQFLFNRFPGLACGLKSRGLGVFPTPVHELRLPGYEFGDLWVKREDLASPLQGGNKVRKLELLLAQGSSPVLTFGPWGSHHVLATAVHGRSLGRDCYAVLVPQPMDPHHEEIRDLIRRTCASTLEVPSFDVGGLLRSGWDLARLVRPLVDAKRCTIIPPGGSSGLGALGYAAAGLELSHQVEAGLCPEPERIYVPLGTGGTAVGLALGLALAGLCTEVVAVQVASLLTGHTLALHAIASRAWNLLRGFGVSVQRPPWRLRVLHGHVGEGYAFPTKEGERAKLLAEPCCLPMESTYTAKTLAAMLFERSMAEKPGPWMFLGTYGPPDAQKISDMTLNRPA